VQWSRNPQRPAAEMMTREVLKVATAGLAPVTANLDPLRA